MMGGGNPLERSGDTSHTKGNALSFCDCGQGWCRCKSRSHCEYLSWADEAEDFSEDWSNNGEREVLSHDEEDWRVNFARRMTGTLLEVKMREVLSDVVCDVWYIVKHCSVWFGYVVRKELGCGMSLGAKNETYERILYISK